MVNEAGSGVFTRPRRSYNYFLSCVQSSINTGPSLFTAEDDEIKSSKKLVSGVRGYLICLFARKLPQGLFN